MSQEMQGLLDQYVTEMKNIYGLHFQKIIFNYNFDNDIQIMPIVKNVEHFTRWLGAYPFYNNVQNEGVELYAA